MKSWSHSTIAAPLGSTIASTASRSEWSQSAVSDCPDGQVRRHRVDRTTAHPYRGLNARSIMTLAVSTGPHGHRTTPCPHANPAYTAPIAPTPKTPPPIAHPTKYHRRPPDHHRGPATRSRCRVQPAPDAGVLVWNPIRQAQPAQARLLRRAGRSSEPTTSAVARSLAVPPAQAGKVKQRQSSRIECENPRVSRTASGMK